MKSEFEFIDRVMPDVPPPTPAQLAAARARLAEAARATPPAAPGRRVMVLAAAAVVLVIGAIAALMPPAARQPAAATPSQVLAAAAGRLAAQPPGAGRYWRMETEELLRTKGVDGYLVEERGLDVLAFGPDGDVYGWYEAVSTTPYGAKNTETWRRAGSPRLCPAPGCDENLRHYPRQALDEALTFHAVRRPGGGGARWAPTRAELLALPQEAAALKAELSKRYPAGGSVSRADWLLETGSRLVLNVPATPGTRAAAYRMLATLPGVSVIDDVRDPAGRAGVALQLPASGADLVQLVIDRQSGDLLAVQHVAPVPGLPPGVPWSASIIKRAGWGDARPVPPPGCAGCAGTY
ncbi:CU044_5270 family protein [Nonomuraea glycinis]|uniref:CU044_5270 family protein n=1 Tax=Nonomuraea glycinis TaxID=2047744 RepID=A0A918A5P7_9ACTN|nr:CU044_5270 family protein [Nonomuraea glycinis]MCA2179024.1 CU044_5270 family protein [Nonomuraea glycinis]GGP08523.1 hypothetical protein GCM10012278_40580 [Nonomuraea glycinis]